MQGEYEKSHDFRPISRFNSETMQDRTIVTMEGESRIWSIERRRFQ